MSSVKDAEQKYKKNLDIVHAFCKKDLSQNKRYVKKMCDLYFEEGVSFNDICSLFAVYEDNKVIFDAVGVNFNQCSYQQLFKLVYKASGDYADKCKLPNEIIESEDKTVSLGLFRTFEEAMNFDGENSWCICVSEGRFEENTADGTLLYIIRNLRFSKGSDCRFVIAQVFNDGTKIYWASNDSKLTDKHEGGHPSIAEYENTINEVLPYIKPKSDDNNKNKQNTKMKTENRNRNVVRLTESKLKQIIAESVKKVLNEKYNVTNMTKGDWDERDATIDTVTDWEDEEDRSEIQKWGGTFVDAITSVDKHLKLAKTNIENLFNGNNEEENGFYNGNDSESDYRYINHVEKCIDNARSALLRLRNRRLMYRGLD